MAQEEIKNAGAAQAASAPQAGSTQPAPQRKKKAPLAIGVIVAIIVVAGAGFWVWHEQPSFCNAICHIPMDPYNVTYDQEPNTQGVDKWGNEVENTSAMLCVAHKVSSSEGGADATCLSCHVPTMSEQISEGLNWISGNYEVVTTDMGMWAATERGTKELTAARGQDADSFCLNAGCHNMTRDELIELTSDKEFNPHVAQHGVQDCTTCHKGHRASVMYCAQCHSDAEVPDGWLLPNEADKLLEK